MEVKGRDLSQGSPRTLTARSEEIRDALREPLTAILESIRQSSSNVHRNFPETSWIADCDGRRRWTPARH